jgi:hypothetical protein
LEPAGDVIAEWRVYTELARRLGVTLRLPGGEIEPGADVSADDVIDLVTAGSKVPVSSLRDGRGGRLFPELVQVVQPPDDGAHGRFQLVPIGIAEELAAVLTQGVSGADIAGFDPARHRFRMSSRRLKAVFNSSGREIDALRSREQTSFAHLHPDDLAELGVNDGDTIAISSPRGSVRAIAKASSDLARGTVSMAHAWGGVPGDAAHLDDLASFGDTTSRLVDNESGFDVITGMAAQSAIPVEITLVASTVLAAQP